MLDGSVEVHSEWYAPTVLKAGDSLYFDGVRAMPMWRPAKGLRESWWWSPGTGGRWTSGRLERRGERADRRRGDGRDREAG